MTRSAPTPEERATAQALIRYLSQGPFEITDVELKDTPDLRLRLNGHAQGYELAAVLPDDIHQNIKEFRGWLYHKRGKRESVVIVPLEPHIWMKEITEKKWGKAQKYEATEFTRNLILIVHPPRILGDTFDYDEDGFIEQLRIGVSCSNHGFAGIGFWTGKRLFWMDISHSKVDHTQLRWKRLSLGYPAYSIYCHMGTDEERLNDAAVKTFGIDDLPKEQVKLLKPRSPQFAGIKPHLPNHIKYEFPYSDLFEQPK
ncbi:hypothetical protein [Massilia sp. Leaf139]|uniref:hypothetical protein n=1 Tax=Massilia sp. Leaf139 TaxID=1736272 RepID=UPI000B213867|nr:hypothetical protein [Massilia sp. Leaf139]